MTDKIELAKRVVDCKGWRWMQGMLAVDPEPHKWTLVDGSTPDRVDERIDGYFDPESLRAGGWLPDLDDPATLGCLLALVREAFGDRYLFVEYVADENSFRIACDFDVRVRVWEASKVRLSGFESEGEALVAALEAAP